jgi:chemotaxis protein methyltransferase CheR
MIENHLYNVEKNYVSLEDKDMLLDFLMKEKALDFREYSEASVRRRIAKILSELNINDVSTYIDYLRDEDGAMGQFIERFTVNVTEMFRDPSFYSTLAKTVLKDLQVKEKIKIWSAGCSTGEEVVSLAILLHENNLLNKTQILGTDLSDMVLETAKKRAYKVRHLESFNKAYTDAGGKHSLAEYYTINGEYGIMAEDLYRNISFEKHNLVGGLPNSGFDLIICRNVLIYFNANLQNKVITTFNKSLNPRGYLALGSKESVIFFNHRLQFKEVVQDSRIYQKI